MYRDYDARVKGLAKSLKVSAGPSMQPPLVVFDSYNTFLDQCNPQTFYQRDLLHLSSAGYKVWEDGAKLALADLSGCEVWRSGVCTQGAGSQPPPPPAVCADQGSACGSLADLGKKAKWKECQTSTCAASCCSSCPATPEVKLGTGNTCPEGFKHIQSNEICLAALQLAGETGDSFWGSETADESWPKGCYVCGGASGCSDGAWYNPAKKGKARRGANVLCEKGLTPITKGQLLLVGDSDIDYWSWSERVFPGSSDVGYGGYTCKALLGQGRDVYYNLDAMLSTFAPSKVLLVCGENDFNSDSVAARFDRFEKVVAKITATDASVLYISTEPEPGTTSLHGMYRDYDARVKGLAKSLKVSAGPSMQPPLVVFDSYNTFLDQCNPQTFYQRDLLHLSSAGYKVWEDGAKLALADLSGCEVWRSGVCTQGAGSQPPPPPAVCADQGSACGSLANLRKKAKWKQCQTATCAASCCTGCAMALKV